VGRGSLNLTGSKLDVTQQSDGSIAGRVKHSFPTPNGKYKGFLIYNEKIQTIVDGGTFDATHLFGKVANQADNKLNKDNIDNFRNVFTAKLGAPTHSAAYPGFSDSKSHRSAFRGFETTDEFNAVNLAAAIPEAYYDSRDGHGNIYNIFDTQKDATHGIRGRLDKNRAELRLAAAGDQNKFSHKYSFNELTRICFEIMDATTVANAVLILYGSDFEEAEGFGNKKKILDKCLIAAQTKNNRAVSLNTYNTLTGGTEGQKDAQYSG